ncbi:MAG: integrin alpha, partial [Myxococcota bacterium]
MRTPRLLAVLLLANCDLPCPNDQPREGCSCPRGSRWARDTGDSGWYGTDDTGAWRPRGDGSENDRLYLTSHAAEFRGVAEGDGFGAAIASLGDRDGDGLAELLVGAPEADAVYLLAGDSLTQGGQTAPGDAWLEGEAGDAFGYATALAGDLDGDGTPDVAIGAPGRDDHAGAAVVALDDGTLTLTGERPGDYAGGALAGAGDVDGDGLADLLVGAWGQDGGATRGGAVYVVLGDALGDGVALADASATLVSGEAGAYLGSALAGGHDYTGDGLPEVVVAAPDAQDARGVVWIVAAGEFAPGEAVDVESFAFA